MDSETTAGIGRMVGGVALGIVLGLGASYLTGNPSMMTVGIGGGLVFAIVLDETVRAD